MELDVEQHVVVGEPLDVEPDEELLVEEPVMVVVAGNELELS